jgi:uncharacterized membrane protein YkvA (DUF1232 family)
MELLSRLKLPGRHMTRDVYALYLAARHPATPWYVKGLLAAAVIYFVSPIDLLPDFTPLLGYLDDAAVLPLLLVLAMSLVPAPLREECRGRAEGASVIGGRVARAGRVNLVLAMLVLAAVALAVLLRAVLT